jgi:predicted alpha/beta-hydrolase family hydrolase
LLVTRPALRVVLGPGAFGRPADLAPHVLGLRRRGVAAEAVALPGGAAQRAAAVFAALAGADVVAGGHSFGGRAASLAAADGAPFAGLLLFGFPLAGRAEERTAHFPRVRCPVLVLNGEADERSPIAALRELVGLLPHGRLVGFPGAGHRLAGAALEQALDEAAEFVRELAAR